MEAGWASRGLDGHYSPEGTGGETVSIRVSREPLAPNFLPDLDTQTLTFQGRPEGQRLGWRKTPGPVGGWLSKPRGGAVQAKALEEEGDIWEGEDIGEGLGVQHRVERGSQDGLGKRPKADYSTFTEHLLCARP